MKQVINNLSYSCQNKWKKSIYVVLHLIFYYVYICLLTSLQNPVNHSSCHFSELICSISTWLFWKMEKAMATHSSTLAWKIPWTEEPGRLQTMGSQRVRHVSWHEFFWIVSCLIPIWEARFWESYISRVFINQQKDFPIPKLWKLKSTSQTFLEW